MAATGVRPFPELHVVFGAGPLGLALARQLAGRGYSVRLVSRSGRAPAPPDAEVVAADAADAESASRAARGARVVYHAVGADYGRWRQVLPPIMDGILGAAAATGARLVYGDNLYAYGRVAGPLTENLPAAASGPNGRLRAELAAAVLAAHRAGRVPAAIGRAADFYGPHVRLSTVGERVFAALLAGQPAQVIGNPDTPHTYTYIDDFARALVTLGERAEALGQVWHVPSAAPLTTRQFVELVAQEAGQAARLRVAPSWAIRLLGLVHPTLRAVAEQLYQSERSFIVDHTKFARAFGAEPTPHPEAIRQTLAWYRAVARERQQVMRQGAEQASV